MNVSRLRFLSVENVLAIQQDTIEQEGGLQQAFGTSGCSNRPSPCLNPCLKANTSMMAWHPWRQPTCIISVIITPLWTVTSAPPPSHACYSWTSTACLRRICLHRMIWNASLLA